MFKQSIILILLILTTIVAISGCTTKTATNGTFGEKVISLDSIVISNNTTADHFNNGTEYYYIEGYLENKNPYDAFHVKVSATAYDANGNVFATNDSAYLQPTVPAKGISYFYIEFNDPSKQIVRSEVKVVDAKGTL